MKPAASRAALAAADNAGFNPSRLELSTSQLVLDLALVYVLHICVGLLWVLRHPHGSSS